jgi:hypothetical protein
MDDRVSVPGEDNDGFFSLRHRVQTGSEALQNNLLYRKLLPGVA